MSRILHQTVEFSEASKKHFCEISMPWQTSPLCTLTTQDYLALELLVEYLAKVEGKSVSLSECFVCEPVTTFYSFLDSSEHTDIEKTAFLECRIVFL